MFAVPEEPVATVTSPAYASTISQETLAHWTRFSPTQGEALTLLLRAAWTEGEASERGITITSAEIREQAEPDPERPRADELFLARTGLLTARIRDQITQPAAQSVTPAQIEAYVAANPRLDPEERRVRVVQARSRARAKLAQKAIERGLSWRIAAKRYGSGGQRTIVKSPDADRFESAVLRAEQGDTTRYGTSVFRITKITPERPAPPDVQRAQAWEILSSVAQRQALEAFEAAFTEKWRARTACPICERNPPTGE
jgi:hypothetical protein